MNYHQHYIINSTLAFKTLLACLLCAAAGFSIRADWPTYRSDYSRSGVSEDVLETPLTPAWKWKSLYPPRPAWQGEAKWDGYNKVYDMKARQIFDRAFHAVIVGDAVYFGSSADDKLYCLDLKTGKERWSFYTEGPVRLAPSFHEGRLYFGSDDGRVYCLNAGDGSVHWKTRPGPKDYRIPGNGRMISAWPVRTGVAIYDGAAYCSAGMFPSEGVYLCALNAETGGVLWKKRQDDLPAQGYILASATRLYVPAGRNNPVVFDRSNGERVRVVEGAGGTYALLTGDSLIFGPGKTGQLGYVENNAGDQLATFQGNHMIVTPAMSYLHGDKSLSAFDRMRYLELAREKRKADETQKEIRSRLDELAKQDAAAPGLQGLRTQLLEAGRQLDAVTRQMTACFRWTRDCSHPYSLILAGDALIAGGDGEIGVYGVEKGDVVWTAKVEGVAYGLAAANNHLIVSTDAGTLECFRPEGRKTALAQ